MRRTTIIALAAVAFSLGAAGSALSADLPRKAPAYVPPPPPVLNWTGFYVGGFLGAATSEKDVTVTELGSTTHVAYNGIGNTWGYNLDTSFIGGGTLGYNWQFANSPFVIGIEGEIGYIHLDGSGADPHSPALDTRATSRVGDWYGVLAGRLGWAVVPNWLLYVKGGAVWTDLHADVVDTCTGAPCGPATVNASGSTTTTGWTVGGGAEWMFAPRWSVKAEYLFLGIDETVRACGPGGGTGAGSTFCWDHDFKGVHTAKLGVNYHF